MQFSHRETTNALVNRGTDNWGMCSQPASQARDSGFCPAGNSSVSQSLLLSWREMRLKWMQFDDSLTIYLATGPIGGAFGK